jgi:hypothetical protein
VGVVVTRPVVIPEHVIELLEEAPKGKAGLTIWETAEGRWQVSVKRPDGSYAVQIQDSIPEALTAFSDEAEVVRRAKRDRLFEMNRAEKPPRRDIIGDRPGYSGRRRYGHPGD